MSKESRTIEVALAANVGAACAKLAAAIVTRSTAMSAEASHGFADAGNQLLLLIARHRSGKPKDEDHPFGYGREAYFWALIASMIVLVAGAVFSLREGISELADPVSLSSFTVVYAVLAISVTLDAVSLFQSVRQLRVEASNLRRDFLDQVLLTSDPTVRAVFVEDAAAIAGDAIAFGGVWLHHRTGSSVYEGMAAVIIGVLLMAVGLQLARRNRDFLLGEQASAATRDRVSKFIASTPGIVSIRELLVTFVGPRQVWVLARVDLDDNLRGSDVEELVRGIENDLQRQSEYVARVDIVPIGPAVP
jgi:cation diffusion facilitator family transporter